MLKVGLTGGIATGKTVVSNILKELGCYVLEADKLAHEFYKPKTKIWEKIVNHFGKGILNPDLTINRAKLANIVFNNDKERNFLNNLIHPLVIEEEKKIFKKIEKEGKYQIFITEAALIVEAGLVSSFDRLIVVYCDEETQLERLIERNNIERENAIRRIKSQFPLKEKLKYADYIIDTSGTLRETVEQTERVFRFLLQDYYLLKGGSKNE
ncbi:dephospho-CoA kinase [Candidatus Aminicenantes bacterium AC-335-A11]|jgi:dephospho-CoA kinase|nr:dephospho-CoA kinase [SCandidatus Aminicenantes bacterium Aminicenantia_JdfR_composite]MCP2597351.1 dephospho-CoA kinase [Candidatus Aminicenantes bacterium AC-335-G13]MCP2598109.1 dephospho-CoA kinase [Candidatus Aminicenantes bacterium AC-335-L06]MCP2618034.1 dephospho-CoA kinase [Candidatus Aminicenantes bacterium AC-335-A11]